MSEHNERYRHLLQQSTQCDALWPQCMGSAVHRRKGCRRACAQRADWLEEFGYTIAEAIERAGYEWVAIIPEIARQLAEEEV